MSTPSAFTVTSTITYRPYRIPPRCRKARPVKETFTHEFTIPSVTSAEAPVVALVPDDRGYYDAPVGEDAPLRSHEGRLYTAVTRGRRPVMAGTDAFRSTAEHESWRDRETEATDEAGRAFKDLLIIDGQVWKTTPEPAYAIVTMGMGGNHGGTYLEIDYAGRYSRQFPLTGYEDAVEAAVAFATKRGDTNTIGIIRKTPRATILDPGAFTIPTEAEKRAGAEADVRAMAAQARDLLAGNLGWGSLGTVKDLAAKMHTLMSQHGIETLSALPEAADA